MSVVETIDFHHADGVTRAEVVYNDRPGESFMIAVLFIRNIHARGSGHGSDAVKKLIDLAKKHRAGSVVAQKVFPVAEQFWKKNGFQRVPSAKRLSDFILKMS